MATMLEVAKRAGCQGHRFAGAVGERLCQPGDQRSRLPGGGRKRLPAESAARNLATKRPRPSAGGDQHPLSRRLFQRTALPLARMTEDKGRQLILADGKHSAEEEREAIQYRSICAAMRLLSIRAFSALMRWMRLSKITSGRSWCSTAACAATPATRLVRSKGLGDDGGGKAYRAGPSGNRVYYRFAGFANRRRAPLGYKDALACGGIALNDSLIVEGRWTPKPARRSRDAAPAPRRL